MWCCPGLVVLLLHGCKRPFPAEVMRRFVPPTYLASPSLLFRLGLRLPTRLPLPSRRLRAGP
eukprot:1837554-Heterocapsa_arctica.AAC.1